MRKTASKCPICSFVTTITNYLVPVRFNVKFFYILMITVEFNVNKFDKFIYTRLHTSNKILFSILITLYTVMIAESFDVFLVWWHHTMNVNTLSFNDDLETGSWPENFWSINNSMHTCMYVSTAHSMIQRSAMWIVYNDGRRKCCFDIIN